jgi:DNA-binding response OmpR family regulator
MTAVNDPTPIPLKHTEISGRSLLIVDDEPVIRTIAKTCLNRAGFDVVEAGDEANAFEEIQKAAKPFDLILLDLTLGETKGADLIPAFRQQSPTTRILVVSGVGAEEAEGLGADGFLAKPFNKTSLLIAVWQALGKQPEGMKEVES